MSTYLTVWVDILFPAGALAVICSCLVLVVIEYSMCVCVGEGGRRRVRREVKQGGEMEPILLLVIGSFRI